MLVCAQACLCCFGIRAEGYITVETHTESIEPSTIEGEKVMALPKRTVQAAAPVDPLRVWSDPAFGEQYPSLYSFLKDTTYEDGSRRLTGSLSVFVKNGELTIAINDNDRLLVAFVNAPAWDEALALLDMGIERDTLPWKQKYVQGSEKKPPF
jgi:hypothetical protein